MARRGCVHVSIITYRVHSVLKIVLSERFRGERLGVLWSMLEHCEEINIANLQIISANSATYNNGLVL